MEQPTTIRAEIGPTLKLAIPIMLGMLGYGLMFVVDVAMAGHLGDVQRTTQNLVVVRVDAAVRCFLNRCSHVPVELDWNYGEFLDDSGRIVVCATHGASYDATDGSCLGGPCDGNPLVKLNIEEKDGAVYWTPSDIITVPADGIED